MAPIEPIIGKYVHISVDGILYRTYFEENGRGRPLVCLHTAAADSTEYRHMLVDSELTERYRVIAFDMPRHGRSLPPANWWKEDYNLSEDFYVAFVVTFCEALGLEAPVLLGCSMGGYVTLDIAARHPQMFAGFVAVQARDYEPAWQVLGKWLSHPQVNANQLIRPLVTSLMCPHAPEEYRREVEWIYMRHVPGVAHGDTYFNGDHDARKYIEQLSAISDRLFVIAGDWDWSCFKEHTDKLAAEIKGLEVTRIADAGHFPMSENPEAFKNALMPILNKIEALY